MRSLGSLTRQAFKKVWHSRFARSVAILASGTAAAQAITMAFSPLITRLYGPEVFGLLGVFVTLISILAPIAALTYPIAIILPKKDSHAMGIAKLAFSIALIVSTITAIVLFFLGDLLLRLVKSDALLDYIMLVPLAMMFAAMLQINQQWLIRKKQFKLTAKIAIAQAFIISSTQAIFGWLNPIPAVLIIIATFSAILHAFMMLIGIKYNPSAQATMLPHDLPEKISQLAKNYKEFVIYRTPQVFMNAVSQSLPILMLASFFGPTASGFYTIGKMVLGMPSTLISKSMGDVFYPRITEAAHKNENLTSLVSRATFALAMIGFIPFAIVIISGPYLFGVVFGSEWVMAGEYARWLAFWFYTMFFTTAIAQTIPVIRQQKLDLIFTVYKVSVRLLSLTAAFIFLKEDYLVVAVFSIVSALVNLQFMFLIFSKIREYDKRRI